MPPRTKTENKQKNPEVDVIKATASTPTKITAVKPKIKKMSPDELVEVKSNFYGTLFYKSKVTGFECEWSNCGDVNLLTIAELQNMRNGQRDFSDPDCFGTFVSASDPEVPECSGSFDGNRQAVYLYYYRRYAGNVSL